MHSEQKEQWQIMQEELYKIKSPMRLLMHASVLVPSEARCKMMVEYLQQHPKETANHYMNIVDQIASEIPLTPEESEEDGLFR